MQDGVCVINRSVRCVQGMYNAMTCVSTVFLVQIYQRFGLDKMTISLVVMLCNLVSIVLQPMWGHLVDRSCKTKETVGICCAIGAIFYFMLVYSGGNFWIITVSAMIIYATFYCMMTLIDSWIARLIQSGIAINYGKTRSMGSICYAIMAMIFGWLATQFGQKIAPYCFLMMFLVLCVGLKHIPNPTCVSARVHVASVRDTFRYLRTNRLFLLIVAAMFLNAFTNASTSTFYSIHIYDLGGDEATVGVGTFLMAVTEVPLMLLFSAICRKFKTDSTTMLATAMVFYALKAFVIGSAQEMYMVMLGSMFHGLAFGIYQPATVMFIVENVEAKYTSTAQTLLHALGMSLPAVLASPVSGAVATATSTGAMLRILSACALLGVFTILIGRNQIARERQKSDAGSITE